MYALCSSPVSGEPMKKTKLSLLCFMILITIYLLISTSVLGSELHFVLQPDFKNNHDIYLLGNATNQGDCLTLTVDGLNRSPLNAAGRVFYKDPLQVVDESTKALASFSTMFKMLITQYEGHGGEEGMAFLMAACNCTPPANSKGGYLGLLNSSLNNLASNRLFAVEFDTHQNTEFEDPDSEHIGININSMKSAYVYSIPNNTNISFSKNQTLQVWIDYDGLNKTVEVRISNDSEDKPVEPVIRYVVDLSQIFQDKAYIGFSASTGGQNAQMHGIRYWAFNSSGIGGGSSSNRRMEVFLIAFLVAGILLIIATAIGTFIMIKRHKSKLWKAQPSSVAIMFTCSLTQFSYKELKAGTKNFSEKECLGRGGSGKVYKAVLPRDGSVVAVKVLAESSEYAEGQFLAELNVIGRVRHKNLVGLRGWCQDKGSLFLVYDYMPNGSLERLLFTKGKDFLSWAKRYEIIKGVAEALHFLHEGLERRVVHRDVKAANVLLDSKFVARLGDFGLARLMEHTKGAQTMTRAGTIGYIAPELAYTGRATEKSDVYGFGVLALEIATGLHACWVDPQQGNNLSLLTYVWQMFEKGRLIEVIDSRLNGDFVEDEALTLVQIGLLCCHPDANSRPSMRKCSQVLSGDAELPALPSTRPNNVYLNLFEDDLPMLLNVYTSQMSTTCSVSASTTSSTTASINDLLPHA